MAEIKLNNELCTLCTRYKDCKSVSIAGVGSKKPKLMIVSDAPTKFDDENGTVLKGSEILEQILYEVVGIDKDDVYLTYAVKCYSPKDKPTAKELNACATYLENEIKTLQPEAVLILGELGMNLLCGTKKISRWKGKMQPIALFDTSITAIATYSPYYVQNAMSFLESWANDILRAWNLANGVVSSVSSTKVVYCDDFDKIRTAVQYCKQVGVASFDFETPKIDEAMGTFLEGFYATTLSLSFQTGSAYVIPLEHKDSPYTRAEVLEIMEYLRIHIFENPRVRKIGHNLNYDFHICRIYGITKLRGRIDDTMLMQHLNNEDERRGLKELVSVYFPEFAGYENDLDNMDWDKIPLKSLIQYNGTDTDLTLRLCIQLENMLQQDEPSYLIYRNLVMAAFRPLWEAETRGMLIDREYLRGAIKEVDSYIERQIKKLRNNKIVKRFENYKLQELTDKAIAEMQEKLDKWVATHKNPTKTEDNMRAKLTGLKNGSVVVYSGVGFNSPKQLQELLYFSPYGFKFKTFDTSTGKDVLEELEPQDDTGFIKDLLLLRSMEKMQGTYLKGIYKRLDKNDRVHTNFRQDGTESGRLSSRNPNLQNMPNAYKLSDEIAVKIVKMVKKSFIPPKGKTLIQIDYSQMELRIIASFARENNMLEVYLQDKDIHAVTASNVMHIPLEQFYELEKDEQKLKRFQAKAVNFGFIYGMSAEGFKNYAKTDYKIEYTSDEAEDTRNAFFKTYPKLLDYHELYMEKARRYGWVRTLFGRRRRTPDIHSSDNYKRSSDERIAVNSPIQGTSGEMTVFSIALMYHRLPKRYEFVNTIHDSIMFYVPDDEVHEAVEQIRQTCENLPTMQYFKKELYKVGMKVDAEGSKKSWADLTEI